jgi:glycine oxidase
VTAKVEFLIIGQGLAGTAMAWELLWRGREVLVVDAGEAVTSSRIAAGLVTPITGQRLALSWRVDEMLAAARPYYERVASEMGVEFFRSRLVRRIFCSASEARVWETRRHELARQPFIARAQCPEAGPFGGCELHGAHLECPGYLRASRAAFERRGCFREDLLVPEEAAAYPARCVIFCQGFAASHNPRFPWIQWKAAKGEILTIRTRGLDPGLILSAGQWLVPDAEGVARTGSTYDWAHLDTVPTAEARGLLERGLPRLHPEPAEVVAHHAAVRPIIRESKALIGRHPVTDKLAFFNGLGSKGSLHAPFFARQLADHLVLDLPLEPECDLRRNV